jgi:hypothetical protein
MTPGPFAAAHLTLDPATTDAMLAAIFGAQRVNPERTPAHQQTQRDASVALIAALRPRDPVGAAYATRVAAAHYRAIEWLRRAICRTCRTIWQSADMARPWRCSA